MSHETRPITRSRRRPTIWFVGGGTGGHLAPGIGLAEWLSANAPVDCVFATSGRPAERAMLAKAGMTVVERRLPIPNTRWNRVRYGAALGREVARAGAGFVDQRPAAVVGLGAYGSLPAALAAVGLGVPLFLLEQNVYPGRVNRLLSRWAHEVYAQWDESTPEFADPARVRVLGNPLRERILGGSRAEGLARLGLDQNKRTVLVMGGSQGAAALNEAFIAAAPLLARRHRGVQWIFLTGERAARVWKGALSNTSLSSAILPYLDRIELAYSAADLVVMRAGGTSLAELLARGLPALLVPYPHAADDHQRANARAAAASGGCQLIEQADAGDPQTLCAALDALLSVPGRLAAMADAARSAGRPDAAARIGARLLGQVARRPAFRQLAQPVFPVAAATVPVSGRTTQ